MEMASLYKPEYGGDSVHLIGGPGWETIQPNESAVVWAGKCSSYCLPHFPHPATPVHPDGHKELRLIVLRNAVRRNDLLRSMVAIIEEETESRRSVRVCFYQLFQPFEF
jgi:hypothetical protein